MHEVRCPRPARTRDYVIYVGFDEKGENLLNPEAQQLIAEKEPEPAPTRRRATQAVQSAAIAEPVAAAKPAAAQPAPPPAAKPAQPAAPEKPKGPIFLPVPRGTRRKLLMSQPPASLHRFRGRCAKLSTALSVDIC